MATSQDIVVCEVCKIEPLQHFCNQCAVRLCNNCVITHLGSESVEGHTIVRYKYRDVRKVKPRQCSTHPTEKKMLFCKNCDVQICVKGLVNHHKHEIVDLKHFVHSKYVDIDKHIEVLGTTVKPNFESGIKQLNQIYEEANKIYDQEHQRMVDAEKELHEKVTEAMKALLDEMETRRNESLTSLSNLKTNIEAKLQTIDQFIYRCEAAKTSLQDILTIKSDERLLDMEHSIKIAFPQYVCPNKLTVDVGTLKSTPKSLGILGIDVEMNIQLPVLRNVSQEKDSTKLEFAAEDDSQTSTQTVSMSIEKVQDKLHQLLVKENLDNEAIFEWIEECVDEITVKSNKFIRALMTAVCESTISGVFLNLFDILHDEDIISEDGFHLWEKSRDPNEQEGKGAAMKEVVLFFTWLREADEDLSDS